MLEFKLKEKEQELKLCELKVKELKKSMPNSKLKPLKARTGRTNISREGANGLSLELNSSENLPSR